MTVLRILSLIVAGFVLQGAEPRLAVLHLVGLDYPRLAHLASKQGNVDFLLSIALNGTVTSVNLISGDGLLADSAAETLKTLVFSPCPSGGGACTYPMSVQFILQGKPAPISECHTEFRFDSPGRIVVTSRYARAIVD